MNGAVSGRRPAIWLALSAMLAGILVLSSVRTYQALDRQRSVYLRSRAGAVAAHLESSAAAVEEAAAQLFDEEPGLLDLQVLSPPENRQSDPLAGLWLGRELYRTETFHAGAQQVFRSYVPFHRGGSVYLVRIDLDAGSADFLVRDARRHLWIASFSAAVLVLLTALALRSLQSAAESNKRRLELEYLAQLGEMAAVLAHEIRNPLGTIKGFAQLLAERCTPRDRQYLEPIVSETGRLERLVNDLLAYGRPTQPAIRASSVREIGDRLQAHVGALEQACRVEIAVSLEEVKFETDPDLLEQALLNLLRNAAEAAGTKPRGSVKLKAGVEGQELVWQVCDDGPGFSPDVQRNLFRPFRTTKAFGTGLGLPVAKKLAESLGGRLHIFNLPEGGAAAEIRMPLTKDER